MKYYDIDMIKPSDFRGGFTVTFQELGYGKKEFERLYKERLYKERLYKERLKQKLNDKFGVKNENR